MKVHLYCFEAVIKRDISCQKCLQLADFCTYLKFNNADISVTSVPT